MRSSSLNEKEVTQSCPTLCKSMDYSPPGSSVRAWNFPGKDTGMCCHFLLQGIFPTQESNPGLWHCRQTLYHLSHQGSPWPGIKSGSPALGACKLEVIIECIMWTWASRLNTAPSSWFIVKITLTGLIIQKTKWTSIQWPGGSFQILFLFYPQSWPVIHRDPLWLAKNKSPFTVLLPIVRLFL